MTTENTATEEVTIKNGKILKSGIVLWTTESEMYKKYDTTTWFDSEGIGKFIKKTIREDYSDFNIVGVVFEDNQIGLIIDNKPKEKHGKEDIPPVRDSEGVTD